MAITRGGEKVRKETRFHEQLKGWERRVSWSVSKNKVRASFKEEAVVCNVN